MEIYLFSASIVLLVIVARYKRIPLLSSFGFFIAFQLLYNYAPFLASRLFPEVSLLGDGSVVNTQLLLATSANVAFGVVTLACYRHVPLGEPPVFTIPGSHRRYVLLALPLFLLTCVLSLEYGWHQYTFLVEAGGDAATGGMYTVSAYVKYAFVSVYLYYLYRFGLDKWGLVLFVEHIVVVFIDGARTTFLPLMVLTLILFSRDARKNRVRGAYALLLGGIFISLAARAFIVQGADITSKIAAPIAIEGVMGSYPSLQSIYGMQHQSNVHYTWGMSYLADPVVWLIPQGDAREEYSTFTAWTKSISPSLTEVFAPMGGFYYVSEAVAAFSYAGPVIVTSVFALMLAWVERNKNKHRLLFMVWTSTIGILFAKTIFGNIFKLFLIQLIMVWSLDVMRRSKKYWAYMTPDELRNGKIVTVAPKQIAAGEP